MTIEQDGQYILEGELGIGSEIDNLTRKLLPLIPKIELRQPLLVTSLQEGRLEGITSGVTVQVGSKKMVRAEVLPNINDFIKSIRKQPPKAVVIIVPSLESDGISKKAEEELKTLFSKGKKIKNPDLYRAWFVVESAANLLVSPKDKFSQEKLKRMKERLKEMGFCVEYHHPRGQGIGFFEARREKKRTVKEKDFSNHPMLVFLQRWMRVVYKYSGLRIRDDSEQSRRLQHCTNFMTAQILIEESEGIKLETINGDEYNGSDDSESEKVNQPQPFEYGKWWIPKDGCRKCGNGSHARVKVYDASREAFENGDLIMNYSFRCEGRPAQKGNPEHNEDKRARFNPGRIINKFEIFYNLYGWEPKKRVGTRSRRAQSDEKPETVPPPGFFPTGEVVLDVPIEIDKKCKVHRLPMVKIPYKVSTEKNSWELQNVHYLVGCLKCEPDPKVNSRRIFKEIITPFYKPIEIPSKEKAKND